MLCQIFELSKADKLLGSVHTVLLAIALVLAAIGRMGILPFLCIANDKG